MEGFSPYIIDSELEQVIDTGFLVEDRYLEFNIPTFVVSPRGGVYQPTFMKESFKNVVRTSREKGYLPFLRREDGRLIIRLLEKKPVGKPKYWLNILLFIITVGTVFYDGYLRNNMRLFTEELMPNTPVLINTLLFLVSILGIFGLHELGHKFVTMREGIEASMPYFIPFLPGYGGTMGAVIVQREPPTNRDNLFDLGLSGPLVGFFVTIIISIVGISLSFVRHESVFRMWLLKYPEIQLSSPLGPPLIELLIPIIKPIPSNYGLLYHPVAFAALVGCLVTFLNLLPIWQTDGGHVTRALLGEKGNRILSLIGLTVMMFCGYYVMAIILAFAMFKSKGDVGPLDDVSPLSSGRKLLVSVYVAILALSAVILFPLPF